jgi:threonine dehydratase
MHNSAPSPQEKPLLTASDVFKAAQRLRQAGLLFPTPLEPLKTLSKDTGAGIWLKLENLQRTGSFKLRGAANKLLALQERLDSKPHVVTASAGNHGLGVAYAATHLGITATIVVPLEASPAKVKALKSYPVELIQHGAGYEEAEAYARQLERERGLTFVSAYNDLEVIAGQGTLALEVLHELPELTHLLVPTGGGGLLSGVALFAKEVNPAIRVIGVQSEASTALTAALKAGHLVTTPEYPTLADGLAGGLEAGTVTFALAQQYVDEMVLVSEESIAGAIRFMVEELHLIAEGSAVVGLAALLSKRWQPEPGAVVCSLITGRNIATEKLLKIMHAQ